MTAASLASARGVVYVHSCPPALCPHVEWAVAAVLGVPVSLAWRPQRVAPGMLRAECDWRGRPGTAGLLVGELRPWARLRFEVTEDASPGCDGERYSHTPGLGLFRATTSVTGDVVVSEDRLRATLAATTSGELLATEVDRLLGGPWDAELEPYRLAGDGAEVRVLTATG